MTISMNDASQLYHENIVEYEDNLYIVSDINSNSRGHPILSLINIADGSQVEVGANPDVVRCPAKYRLGYMQLSMGDNASYLQRSPRRQYSLGWSRHNVPNLPTLASIRRSSNAFLRCLEGKFPPYETALKLAIEKNVDVSFDKQFAVRHGGQYIKYRGEVAINITSGDQVTPHLPMFSTVIPLFNELRVK